MWRTGHSLHHWQELKQMRIKIEKRINKKWEHCQKAKFTFSSSWPKIEFITFAIIVLFYIHYFLPIHLNTIPSVGHSVNTPCLLFIQRKEASSSMINADSTTIKRTAMMTVIVSFFWWQSLQVFILPWPTVTLIRLTYRTIKRLSMLRIFCLIEVEKEHLVILTKFFFMSFRNTIFKCLFFLPRPRRPTTMTPTKPMLFRCYQVYSSLLDHLLVPVGRTYYHLVHTRPFFKCSSISSSQTGWKVTWVSVEQAIYYCRSAQIFAEQASSTCRLSALLCLLLL